MRISNNKKGQSIVEYVIVFTVVVGAVVFAAGFFLKPSVQGLYQRTATVIDQITPTFVND